MHGLEKLIKSACNCLQSSSQGLELEIHTPNEYTIPRSDSLFRIYFVAQMTGQHFVEHRKRLCIRSRNFTQQSAIREINSFG